MMDQCTDFPDLSRFHDDAGEWGDYHQSHLLGNDPQAQYSDQQTAYYHDPTLSHQMLGDIKPRLTKEQHDVLEAHYVKQAKPNTNTKKGFADALNVSLDKVNNWFQNRRAKSKQDAKKQAGAFSLFQAQQASGRIHFSNPEVLPSFVPPDYFVMMQDEQDHISNGLGMNHVAQFQEQGNSQDVLFPDVIAGTDGFNQPLLPQQMPQDMFDSPEQLNRRTLTQEHFDALAQHNPFLQGTFHDFNNFVQGGFSQSENRDVLSQAFEELPGDTIKQQDVLAYSSAAGQPLSSVDSTPSSTMSEDSLYNFPPSTYMQDNGSISASSSEWAGSRSSSIAMNQQPELQHQQQQATTTSQWQPGQSVPVDFNALSQQFQQAARAKQSPPTRPSYEQPLGWPADEAFERRERNDSRDCSASKMLAQSMSNVGLTTPQPQQSATAFKTPAPPASIATRRQRPKPAALGIGALRSQSYSGSAAPSSPGQHLAANGGSLLPDDVNMRRVKSQAVLNGRVQKSVPGSAQRSPLSWTFPDAMKSPKVARHMSNQSAGNLAPPTPLSPNDFPRPEPPKQWPPWRSAPGHNSRQASISEHDIPNSFSYVPSSTVPPHQHFSSPPSTPAFNGQQQIMHHPHFTTPNMENTPPKSAPAGQQCFPVNFFAPPQTHQHHAPPQQQPQQQMQPYVPSHSQHFVNAAAEQQIHMPNVTFAPSQPFTITTSGPAMEIPRQFAPQVPIVNAAGQLQMAFAPQIQLSSAPPQQIQTPPIMQQHQFITSGTSSAGAHITPQMTRQHPQPPTEFVVHEYSPPQDIKRAVTPRRPVDAGPKNYTFANQGPEHFERGKKGSQTSSATAAGSSPTNSIDTTDSGSTSTA